VAGPPTGLSVVAHSGDVDVTWSNQAVYTSLIIRRKLSGGSYATIATLNIDDEAYTDTDTLTTATYYWKVTSSAGDSNEDSWTFTAWTSDGTDTVDVSDYKDVGVSFTVSATETFSLGESTEVAVDSPVPQAYEQNETDTVTISDTYETAHIGSQNWRYYLGSSVGGVHEHYGNYYGDAEADIDAYYQTKALDFADQFPDYADTYKSLTRIYLDYVDLIECPITVSVSTDNGSTWTSSYQTLGSGELTVKRARYDFAWVTGRFFVVKLSHSSNDRTFQFVKMAVEFEPHTDYFAVS